MNWRTALLAGSIILAASCGHNEPAANTATADTTGQVAPGSGGYVRHEPGNKRVIVFVNGIFGDAKSTWENGSTRFYWPQAIANDPDFAGTDVYVHSFDSPKLQTAQQITTLADRLGAFLGATDHVLDTHDQVVFLCHSMGGLVTRAFLLGQRVDPAKVPMIYFFATPTGGANVADIASKISPNQQLHDMVTLEHNGYLLDLMKQWMHSDLRYAQRIQSNCAAELRDTGPVLVVDENSAFQLCTWDVETIAANHIDIVKPSDARDDPYVFFKQAYQRTFGPQAAVVRQIAVAPRPQLRPGEVRSVRITAPMVASLRLATRDVKAGQFVEVGCGQTREGDVTLSVPLEASERVLTVIPYLDKAENLKDQRAVLVSHDKASAVVHYTLTGLDANCGGAGSAYVAATFVTEPLQARQRPQFVPLTKTSLEKQRVLTHTH